MPTSAINNTYTSPAYQPKTAPNDKLDKNGFLKMLTEQLRNQDPKSSQDPTQYFQTISQMTVVEQLTNLSQQSADALKAQKSSDAQAMLGRTVGYLGKDGLPVTGTVERVDLLEKTGPTLTVAGVAGIDPSIITQIA